MSLSLSHVPVPVWIIRCSPQAHAHHALLTPQALMLKALVHAHAHALLSSTLTHAHGSPQWLMISHAQSLSLSRSSCISRNPILYIPASGDFCFTSDSRTKNDFRQARSLTPPKRTFQRSGKIGKFTKAAFRAELKNSHFILEVERNCSVFWCARPHVGAQIRIRSRV